MAMLFLVSFVSHAEVLTLKIGEGNEKKINVEKLESFHVNDECIKEKKKCLALLKIPKKTITTKASHDLAGNPASLFCRDQNGKAEILHDSKNNEYDYCVLDNKYFIDSWDFYSSNHK